MNTEKSMLEAPMPRYRIEGDEIGNASRHLPHHLRRHFAGHPFDLRQIAVMMDAQVDRDRNMLLRQV